MENATLTALRARLTACQAKILEVLQTGEEYTLQGSHSVRNPTLTALETEENTIRRKILLVKGYTNRVYPSYQ